jgi:hypothetical protein
MKTYIRLEETTHKANFFEQGAAEKKRGGGELTWGQRRYCNNLEGLKTNQKLLIMVIIYEKLFIMVII